MILKAGHSGIFVPALAALLAAVVGCAQVGSDRPKQHSSAQLLKSGTTTRVTRRQAADVQIAMARTLEESEQLPEAEAAYREALKRNSKRADAHHR